MARPNFPASQDSYVLAPGGLPQAGVPVRIWNRSTGGSQLTDLVYVNADGTLGGAVPGGVLTSNGYGLLPAFAGPDGGATVVYGDHGMQGERIALFAASGGGGGGAVSSVVGQTGAVTGTQIAADAALTGTYAQITDVDARTFGVVANGPTTTGALTTNTTALQAFVDYIVNNGLSGQLPAGTIHINAAINFSRKPAWTFGGLGSGTTTIEQHTDNVPILNLGSDTASSCFSFQVRDLALRYTNTQPSTNLGANCIRLSESIFEGAFRNIRFLGGSWAMSLVSGKIAPWGCSFDDLQFGSGLTGGAINWTGNVGGVPNNHFGRLFVDCANMVGPVFVLHGDNSVIDVIEMLSGNLSPVLMSLAPGSMFQIGAMKLEIGTYSGGVKNVFEFGPNAHVDIGHLLFGGNTTVDTGTTLYLVRTGLGGGAAGRTHIGKITASLTTNLGNAYIAGAGEPIGIDNLQISGGWQLQNNSGSDHGERVRVAKYVSGHVSQDKGDADYVVTVGDPNVITYQTAFTASRTITLPGVGGDLHNGVWYDIVVDGAVSDANPLVIKSGSTTLRTQSEDKVTLRYVWRRNVVTANGWVLTEIKPGGGSALTSTIRGQALVSALIFGGN